MRRDVRNNRPDAGPEGVTGKGDRFMSYFILHACILAIALCLNACGGGSGGSSGGSSGGTEESSEWDSMSWDQGTWG